MVYVRSRKFCCCLPVRFGVFCESILGIAVGGFFAVAGWIEIHAMRECFIVASTGLGNPVRVRCLMGQFVNRCIRRTVKGTLGLSHTEKIALWCLAISMTIFALTSLLG